VRAVPSTCLIEHSPSVSSDLECGTLCNVLGSLYRIEWALSSMFMV
jgi:hypothetical protein